MDKSRMNVYNGSDRMAIEKGSKKQQKQQEYEQVKPALVTVITTTAITLYCC